MLAAGYFWTRDASRDMPCSTASWANCARTCTVDKQKHHRHSATHLRGIIFADFPKSQRHLLGRAGRVLLQKVGIPRQGPKYSHTPRVTWLDERAESR